MKSYKNKKSDQPQADNSHINVTNEDDTVTPKAPLSKSSDQDKALTASVQPLGSSGAGAK